MDFHLGLLVYLLTSIMMYGALFITGRGDIPKPIKRGEILIFRPHVIWKIISAFTLMLPLIPAYIYFSLPNSAPPATILLFGLFISFLGLGVACAWVTLTSWIAIESDQLIFKYAGIRSVTNLDSVNYAYMASGYIVLDVGQKRRKIIPAIFKGNTAILEYIRLHSKSKWS